MNTNDLKSRFRIATLALAVGLAVLFLGNKISLIARFDSACVREATKPDTPGQKLYDVDPESNTITVKTLSIRPEKGKAFQIIHINDDPDRIFEHSPPSALDYAVMLESLFNRGYKNVILTTRMSWGEHPGLEAESLSSRLALFDQSVIALPMSHAATAQPLPAPVQRSLIPYSQVKGSHRHIPLVNQVQHPTHTDGGNNTHAGFHQIESSPPSDQHIPLLAHWQDHGLIPSIELLAIMVAHNIRPAQLIIHCGKDIRLGKDGPVIPLDEHGQTPIPTALASPVPGPTPLEADKLITPNRTHNTSSNDPTQTHIALIHAVGKNTLSTNTLDTGRLSNLLALSHSSPVPETLNVFRPLPLWAAIILILDIALITCWFAEFSRSNRHLAYMLTAALLFPMLLALLGLTQHWLPLSAPLTTLITAWLIPIHKPTRQKTTPTKEYRLGKTRPVIRV